MRAAELTTSRNRRADIPVLSTWVGGQRVWGAEEDTRKVNQ